MVMSKLKKIIFTLFIIISICFTILILGISPLLKYFIEKYDEAYTGRKIEVKFVYVNIFTNSISFKKVKIFELKSDSLFVSIDNLSAKISLLNLIHQNYEIKELIVNRPTFYLSQDKKEFNFKDILKRLSDKKKPKNIKPISFSILQTTIKEGKLLYQDIGLPLSYAINNINLKLSSINNKTDSLAADFAFNQEDSKGDVKGALTINLKNLNYHLAINIRNFDLRPLEVYLDRMTSGCHFACTLDAKIKTKGNILHRDSVATIARIELKDLHFGSKQQADDVSIKRVLLRVEKICPQEFIYRYDSVAIIEPFVKYTHSISSDNFQDLFGKNGSKISAAKADSNQFNIVIELAHYLKVMSRNLFKSAFQLNHAEIKNGNLKFTDNSNKETCVIQLNNINFIADSIFRKKERVNMILSARVLPFGNACATLRINPANAWEFELDYYVKHLSAVKLNAYIIPVTSFAFTDGSIELTGNCIVRDKIIKGTNHLTVFNPRVQKQVLEGKNRRVPVHLLLNIMKERNNAIYYEIPISGNIQHPKMNLKKEFYRSLRRKFSKAEHLPSKNKSIK
jgi:hypothetical protein